VAAEAGVITTHRLALWAALVAVSAVVATTTALAFGGGTTYEERRIVEIPRRAAVVHPRVAPLTVVEHEPQAPPPPRMKPPIEP
jgi:hypothetical protein